MPKRSGISKWQMKSARVNKIRWELQKILDEDFSKEEKESEAYRELVESVETILTHSIPELAKNNSRTSWKTVLLISLAGSGGAVLLKIVELVTTWLGAPSQGGTP